MRVPTYERRVSRVMPSVSTPRELPPPPEAFGAEIAESLTRLGETGQKIAGMIAQRAQERRKELMTKQIVEQDTAFRQELQGVLYNKDTGFLNRKLDQAQDITPEFDQAYNGIREKYLNNVQYQEQKDTLSRMLDQTYLSTRDNVIRYERQQTDESIQNSFKSNLDIQANDAAQLQDGPSVIRAIDQAVATQNALSKINGYDEKTAEAERIKIRGKVAKSAFSTAMTENNLIKAQSIYNAIKDKIPAEIKEKMKEEIDSGIPYRIAVSDAFLDPFTTRKKLESNAYNIKDPVKRKAAFDFTSTLADKMIVDSQESRYNDFLGKLAQGDLTLMDIENEMQIPEDIGGIKKTILKKHYETAQRGIEKDLNRWLQEKEDREPTKRARQVKEYVDLIDSFTNDDVDKWHAREKLAEAYSDGIINSKEVLFLNTLKTNLKDIEFNRSSGPIVNTIKAVKSWLNKNNATDEETTLKIKQLLGTLSQPGKVPQDEAKSIMHDHLRSKIPEIDTMSSKGQLMMDAYGNKAMVYPDGTIEPITTYREKEEQR